MNIGKIFKRIFNKRPMDGYRSDIDKFFEAFDKTHPKSESQLQEIKKHQRIASLRDNPVREDIKEKIWEGF